MINYINLEISKTNCINKQNSIEHVVCGKKFRNLLCLLFTKEDISNVVN